MWGENILKNNFNILREIRHCTDEQKFAFKLKTEGNKNKRALEN